MPPTHDELFDLFNRYDAHFGNVPEFSWAGLARLAADPRALFARERDELVGAAVPDGAHMFVVDSAHEQRAEVGARMLHAVLEDAFAASVWIAAGDDQVGREARRCGLTEAYIDIHMRKALSTSPPHTLPDGFSPTVLTGPQDRQIHRAVHDLVCEAWDVPPHLEAFLERFVQRDDYDPRLWMIASDGEGVCGAVIGRLERAADGPVGGVAHLDVAPRSRRQGLGPALLARLCTAFAAQGMVAAQLGVHDDNRSGAPGLYQRLGWRTVSRRQRFVRGEASGAGADGA
jgi:GNAT superfamily N-acetyltransferase